MIRLEGVSHTYTNGTVALRDVDLNLNSNDFTVLIGPSGAGKSTLMRVLNGLVKPSNGLVWLNNLEVTHANETQVRLERRSIGMVFQQFNLVKRMTALENVLIGRLGFMTAWRSTFKAYTKADRELAFACLERVGMSGYAWQRADTLSGGQQQRVGIARALAQQPKLILADEPRVQQPRLSGEDLRHFIASATAPSASNDHAAGSGTGCIVRSPTNRKLSVGPSPSTTNNTPPLPRS